MKRDYLRSAFALVVGLMLSFTNVNAQTFDLGLSTGITSCQYCATVQIKSAGSPFNLGGLSFIFSYNDSALTFASYTSINFDENSNCGGNQDFMAHSPFVSNGQVSAGTAPSNFSGFTSCPPIGTSWVDIAEICFDIVDETQTGQLVWSSQASQIVASVSEDLLTDLDIGTLTNVDEMLVCSATGGGGGGNQCDIVASELSFDCETNQGVFTYCIMVNGGVPADDPGASYLLTGTGIANPIVAFAKTVTCLPSYVDGTQVDIVITDSNGCQGTFSSNGPVACSKDECPNPIVVDPVFNCDNDSGEFTLTFNISGGEPGSNPQESYTVNGTGVNNASVMAGIPFTVTFVDGTGVDLTFTDTNGCSTFWSSNGPIACAKGDCVDPIVVTPIFDCNEAAGEFTYTFSISGGAPGSNSNEVYTVNGTGINNVAINAGASLPLTFVDGSSVTLNFTDSQGCSTVFSSNGPVACSKVDCTDPIVVTPTFDCNESSGEFTYTFSISGGAPGSNPNEVYTVNGTGVNNVTINAGTPLPLTYIDGTSVALTFTDSQGCETTWNSGGPIACSKDDCSDPIVITNSFDCDEDAGVFTYTFSFTGGAPATDATEFYTVTGSGIGAPLMVFGGNPIQLSYADGSAVSITVVDSKGCSTQFSTNGAIPCTKIEPCVTPTPAVIQFQNGSSIATICIGSGQMLDVSVSSNPSGDNGFFLVTDGTGTTILAGPATPPLNFDNAPPGNCLIWHITYDGNLSVPTSMLVSDLVGCFALSNSLTVVRHASPIAPQINAVSTGGASISVCNNTGFVNDVTAGIITAGTGAMTEYVLSDSAGNIVAGPQISPNFNLLGSMGGTYSLWAIAYSGNISHSGTVSSIAGCFALSNAVDVTVIANCTSGGGGNCPVVTANSGLVTICSGDTANLSGTISGQGNYAAAYVLHTTPMYAPSSVVATSFNGVFANPGPGNITYYMSILVGTDLNADGVPEANSECYAVYPGQQVAFLTPVNVAIASEICDDDTGTTTVSWVITGGFPQFSPGATYSVTGSINQNVGYNEVITSVFADSESSVLNVVDSFCGQTVSVGGGPYTCKVLPISLLVFDGEVQGKGNLLYWITATEIDNDYFTLERSLDGFTFEGIAIIDGAGNSLVDQSYEFLDEDARPGTSYYRLRQTDFNNTTTVTEAIELYREFNDNIITISPVPANHFITVSYEAAFDVEVRMSVYDIVGRQVISREIDMEEGINNTDLGLDDLTNGVYLLSIETEGNVITKKFIKN